ncbi:MAG TPA: oligosaccharide flippase family protein [Bryobacteraceae bacterium]|nr:oligosaccharide flippase family protein [Bryobacteraceae bacterium]
MNAVSGQPAPARSHGRLWENIASLSALQVLNYAVPLATVPYLVRVMGPAQFGLLSFAQAIVLYFNLVTDYGFSLSATRAVASRRDDPEELADTFWRTMFAKVAVLLVSGAALTALVFVVPRLRQTPLLYAAAFLNVAGTVACPVWFFQGIEEMRVLTIAHSAARLLTIPALMLFVRSPEDTVRAAAIQGAVPLLASLLLVPALRRRVPGGPRLLLCAEIPAVLREGWHLFIAHTSLAIHSATTAVVLGLVAGNTQVGYYSAADKVIRAATSATGPVAQALYPHLNSLKTQSMELTLDLMRRSFGWILLLAAAASLATFLLAAPLGLLLWGPAFGPSIAILRCLSPLPFLLASVNIIGTQTMLLFEMDRVLTRTVVWCALINIPLTAVLSLFLGALGAAVAIVLVAVVMVLSLAWSLRRRRLAIWRAAFRRA